VDRGFYQLLSFHLLFQRHYISSFIGPKKDRTKNKGPLAYAAVQGPQKERGL
jgi:hypothetical protein